MGLGIRQAFRFSFYLYTTHLLILFQLKPAETKQAKKNNGPLSPKFGKMGVQG